MSELIHELSDSELDAIAGGQVAVIGTLNVGVATTASSTATVTTSINSSANARTDVGTNVDIG